VRHPKYTQKQLDEQKEHIASYQKGNKKLSAASDHQLKGLEISICCTQLQHFNEALEKISKEDMTKITDKAFRLKQNPPMVIFNLQQPKTLTCSYSYPAGKNLWQGMNEHLFHEGTSCWLKLSGF